MDLLSLLGAGGTVATRAKTATLQGRRAGREDQQADLLARIAEQRQVEDRERRTVLDELNRRNIESQITTREAPTLPKVTPPELQVVDNQVVNLGEATARPITGFTPTPPKPVQDPVTEQNRFTRERGLRSDFQGEQAVKDASGVAGAATTIRAALTNPTPQGDLAAIYALVKLYDPGSVVREGEISLTQSAASLPEQVRRMYEGWTQGKKLTPQMRADLAAIADSIVSERQTQINPILQQYGQSARRWGVDSASVAPNPLQGLGPTFTTSTGKTLRVVKP